MNLLTVNHKDNILCQNSASNSFLVSRRSPGLGMLVVIDPRVENYGILASGVLSGAKVVILESGEDGVRQVSRAIANYRVSSLHIICHGSPGSLQLGNTRLSLENLAAYGAELERWGDAIGFGGILLYGCEVAAGDIGAAFVGRLHELSGVGVAAAVSRVGCAELGGSWELGVKVGNVGDSLAFEEEVLVGYGGVFANLTVNSTDDNQIDGDGLVTLREAILAANNDTTTDLEETGDGADTIIFDSAVFGTFQTITLTSNPSIVSGGIIISDDLTIAGTGESNLTISGGDAVRVFNINNATVTINDVTISNGSFASEGGGILIETNATATINNSTISNNYSNQGGGGIFNRGNLEINDSTISNNRTNTENNNSVGGGIYNGSGNLTLNNSTISGNVSARGAGIYNRTGIPTVTSLVTINNGNISNNTAIGEGGGILNVDSTSEGVPPATVRVLAPSTISNNSANSGGGISNNQNAVLQVHNSTISSNAALELGGGGIDNEGNAVISNNTISGNSSAIYGGGINNDGTGTVTVINSTISTNNADDYGGGSRNVGNARITNSTISGNLAGNYGGGIWNDNTLATSILELNNSTITQNIADNNGDNQGNGGGIANDGTANINNTIIAGNFDNSGSGTVQEDVSGINATLIGAFNSNGSNLIGNIIGSSGFLDSEALQIPIDSVLETTLQNNGGITETHALVEGANNPAIDTGNDGDILLGIEFDQRGEGFPRINGAVVDIGAFEASQIITPTTFTFTNDLYSINEDSTLASESIQVERSGDTSGSASVQVRLSNGTATGSATPFIDTTLGTQDFDNTTITLTFSAGQIFADIPVTINDDTAPEPTEELNLNLVTDPATGTVDDTATLQIIDNDAVSISINDVTVNENQGVAEFIISLSQTSNQDVTVNYSTSDDTAIVGQDYTAVVNNTVTIPETQTTATVTVSILNDEINEQNETFNVNLSDAVNAVISDSIGVGTIIDDDNLVVPNISINDVTVNETDGNAVFTVSLDQPSNEIINLNYSTNNGTAETPNDYIGTTFSTISIPAGETSGIITVPIVNDNELEGNETFNVDLTFASIGNIINAQGTATITDNNFLGSISGVKFLDNNQNGIQELPDETGLGGFTIYLDQNNNNIFDTGELSTITNADGSYIIDNIPPDTYTVREVQQAGFTQTTTDPIVTVVANQDIPSVDFGNFQQGNLGSISGVKFSDQNQNGIQDLGEIGLAGFTIYLDINENGILDNDEPQTLSDFNGFYSFNNLPLDNYIVREQQQQGFVQTTPEAVSVTLSLEQPLQTVNIGNFPQGNLGSISGVKFADDNQNGIQDLGELGLGNFILYLDINGNGILEDDEPQTLSDFNGFYSFNNLALDNYIVREQQQQGFVQTTPEAVSVTLSLEQPLQTVNIGNFSQGNLGSISGVKFADENQNGIQDLGELGLGNFTIYLDINENGILDNDEPQTLSDVNGFYSFNNLGLDNYIVREQQQQGFVQTTPEAVAVTLSLEQPNQTVNIGNFSQANLGSISGVKFSDENQNGIQDLGEIGLVNFIVYLDTNGNGILDNGEPQTLSDVNGFYSFNNLGLDNYIVREQQQQGFVQTTPEAVSVTLSSEQLLANVNIGNFQSGNLGSISGVKFSDQNQNGIQESTEIGLGNFIVYLDINGNGILEDGEPQTLSDVNGFYSFNNLPLDNYIVREQQQQGFVQTTPEPVSVTLSLEQPLQTVNIGNFSQANLGSISGVKFSDENQNGIQDLGELGLGNFTIYLDINGNGILEDGEPQTLSDVNGFYSFNNLPLDNYIVREQQQQGFVQTTPEAVAVTLSLEQPLANVNIGNSPQTNLGSISGVKFSDQNQNGIQDLGEIGLAGFTIYLDINENGILDNDEPQTLSDVNGFYSFNNLPLDNYIVREQQQQGFVQTTPEAVSVTLSLEQPLQTVNIGNFSQANLGSISGVKFSDNNQNGIQELPDETGLGGFTIYLDQNNNNIFDTGEVSTTTNVDGSYLINDIPPGTYTVREVQQSGFTQTTIDSLVTLAANQNISGIDFGNFQPPQVGSISGVKFSDNNQNGIQELPDETGLGGFTIYLDQNNNNIFDTGEVSTITNVDGSYILNDIPPGTYTLREVQQPGFTQTTIDSIVTLAANQNISGIDFGNFQPPQLGSISGTLFNDLNNNNFPDSTEGIGGITLFLDSNNNNNLDPNETNTLTNPNGNYNFSDLEPNTYNIRAVPQGNFIPAPIPAITLSPGQNATNINVQNNISPGSISGITFNDTNRNGSLDPGETGLGNIAVFLDTNQNDILDSNEQQTVTNESGIYSFSNLLPDNYTLRTISPPDAILTTAAEFPVPLSSGQNVNNINFGYSFPNPGTLQFSNPTFSVTENQSTATVTVIRTGGSDGVVSANINLANGTASQGIDYGNPVPETIFFADEETQQTVSIPIIDDNSVENTETVNLSLANVTGAANIGQPATATLEIIDDDLIQPQSFTTEVLGFEQFANFDPISSIRVNTPQGPANLLFSGNSTALVSLNQGGQGRFTGIAGNNTVLAYDIRDPRSGRDAIVINLAEIINRVGEIESGSLLFDYASPNRSHSVTFLDENNLQLESSEFLERTPGELNDFSIFNSTNILIPEGTQFIAIGSQATELGIDNLQLTLQTEGIFAGSSIDGFF